ncbi:MAG: serine aminopeptidase domain-containing protein [Mucilaginibacter sp.]
MKKTAFLIFLVLFGINAFAQTEPANYTVAVNKFKLYYNNNQPDSLYAMFGPEMKNALSPAQCRDMVSQFKTQLGALQQTTFTSYTQSVPVAMYRATFQNAPISLSLSLNGESKITGMYLRPIKEAAPVAANPTLDESPIVLKTLSGTIRGTLTMPKNATGKMPVVIIAADSGPTDRNGNNDKLGINTNTYKLMAEGLAKSNIATVRYDKRMVGESETRNKESDLRFDDYVDDAVGLIGMLNDDPRFSKVIILGHGEGGLVAMLATHDQPVKACIIVAATSEQGDKFLIAQLKSRSQFMQDAFKTLVDSMRKGKTIDNIDPSLYFIASPAKQRFLISYCRYPPLRVMKFVKMPTLIIQGTNDLQNTVADGEKLKKAKSDAVLVTIPGMNHILKDAPTDKDQNLATYNKPDLPLKPELIPAIVDFITKLN